MSDDESDFVYESDEDNFDEEENDDEAVTIENHYYEADDQKLSDPAKALAGFQLVVGLENERKVRGGVAVWKFKSLQNIVILSSRLGGKAQSMSETYKVGLFLRIGLWSVPRRGPRAFVVEEVGLVDLQFTSRICSSLPGTPGRNGGGFSRRGLGRDPHRVGFCRQYSSLDCGGGGCRRHHLPAHPPSTEPLDEGA